MTELNKELNANTLKGRAKKFLQKLLDSTDEPTASSSGPQAQVAIAPVAPDPPPNPPQNLYNSFNALSISPQDQYYQPAPQSAFVGGFHPSYAAPSDPSTQAGYPRPNFPVFPNHSDAGPLSSPVSPSAPMSLTMQHALQPPQVTPPRPHSTPAITSAPAPAPAPPPVTPGTPSTPLKPSTPSKPPATPPKPSVSATPSKPKHNRASSSVSSGAGQVQCSGVTKAGKRCARMVKCDIPQTDDDDDSESQEVFCHQHTKELLGPSGFYARKNGEWVNFDDWIPEYLQQDIQVALRVEMEKSRTQSDVPGYIYTFEIRGRRHLTSGGSNSILPQETTPQKTVKLKVGRAVNLVKRIDQWGKQCGSKEQVLRGWYPGTVDGEDGNDGSLMKGRVTAGEKAAWCHRLERLIHIELGALAATCVYLQPSWPNCTAADVPTAKVADAGAGNTKPCDDCGAMHKEIFEFRRFEKGKNKAKEWELVVKPVVERWGRFVDLYL